MNTELLPTSTLLTLTRDESTGLDVAPLSRSAVRLHRDRRGAITILFCLLAFLFFTALSGIWNMGQAISAKQHTQTVADTSSYGAAVWMSRGMNQITATNMIILRNTTAFINALMSVNPLFYIGVVKNWKDKADEACAACLIFCAACEAATWIYIIAVELPVLINFMVNVLPEAIPGLWEFPDRCKELFEYQQAWVDKMPEVVEAQRKKFEEFYNAEIRYTQPSRDDGEVHLPVEEGNFLDYVPVVAWRFYNKDNNIPDEYNFNIIALGEAEGEWDDYDDIMMALGSVITGQWHHILDVPKPFGITGEKGPESLDEREKFTVMSSVMIEDVAKERRVAPGIFNYPFQPNDVQLAYAQAETYNGPSETMHYVASQMLGPAGDVVMGILPFRVWTTWGWQWQPRLAASDQFETALENDPDLKDWFEKIHVKVGQNVPSSSIYSGH